MLPKPEWRESFKRDKDLSIQCLPGCFVKRSLSLLVLGVNKLTLAQQNLYHPKLAAPGAECYALVQRQFPLFDPTKPPPSLLTSLAPPFHHCGKPFDLGLLSEIFRLSMIVYLYYIICTRKEDLVYIHWIGSIAWCWVQSLQMMIYILNSSHITYSLLSAKIACKAKGGLCRYLWPFLMDGMMSHPSYPIGTGRPQHLSEPKSYRKLDFMLRMEMGALIHMEHGTTMSGSLQMGRCCLSALSDGWDGRTTPTDGNIAHGCPEN